MDWKMLLACITGSVEEELLLRNEYLVVENRLLRNQIEGRLQLTDAERQDPSRDRQEARQTSPGGDCHHRQTRYDSGLASQVGEPKI